MDGVHPYQHCLCPLGRLASLSYWQGFSELIVNQAISFVEIYTILRFDWDVPVYPRFFQLTFNELMHLCYALSFTLNFLITVTIATRRFLAMRGRWLSNGGPEAGTSFPLDNKKSPGYNKATILLVDAALPPTLCSFAILVAYFTPYSGLRIQGVFAVLWLTFSVRISIPT